METAFAYFINTLSPPPKKTINYALLLLRKIFRITYIWILNAIKYRHLVE